jgi:predicted SAM-dependent methyltransferase
MKCLNLGCGSRIHPAWTNLDLSPAGQGVIVHDLRRSIPFSGAFFDVVYCSHLLEHFSKADAKSLMKECYRVLRSGGILRVAVPDLEKIVRDYLRALELARAGSEEGAANYEWMMIELYDQAVRTHSGGEMLAYFRRKDIPNRAFVIDRCGSEAKSWMEGKDQDQGRGVPGSIQKVSVREAFQQIVRLLISRTRERLIEILLGNAYTAFQIGRFREGGEVHQWMYDEYSLGLLLKNCGFEGLIRRTPTESYIPEWADFHLDTGPDRTIHKPDSLFLEGLKPKR